MNNKLTAADRRWLALVKSLPCVVCGAPPPSEANHMVQGQQYTTTALCQDCHTGTHGWHGDKTLWRIYKMDQLRAINATVKAIFERSKR